MDKKWLAVLFSVLFILGCSREGFADSLNRSSSLLPESSSDEIPVRLAVPFSLKTGEIIEENVYILFAQPSDGEDMSEVAAGVSVRMHELLGQIPSFFDLEAEGASLEVYDGVTRNDGEYFSVVYEGSYSSAQVPYPTKLVFGLTFNAQTGEQLTIDQLIEPQALAALMLDEQSSTIKSGNAEQKLAQQEYLEGVGLEGLAMRIEASKSQSNVDQLLTFSFYLEEGRMVTTIPVPHALGDVVVMVTALV